MKRTFRLMLASAGAVAVVTGGALGVAYATTPNAHPASDPSSVQPTVVQTSGTPEATTTHTPESAEPTGTVTAENEATETEKAKDPTTRPTATGTATPRADCSGTPDGDRVNGTDADQRDHHRPSATPSGTRTPDLAPSADRTHRTRH